MKQPNEKDKKYAMNKRVVASASKNWPRDEIKNR